MYLKIDVLIPYNFVALIQNVGITASPGVYQIQSLHTASLIVVSIRIIFASSG